MRESTFKALAIGLMAAVVVSGVLFWLFSTDQRKYVINDLPADDAMCNLLTDGVLRELAAGQIQLLSSEHVLLLADALMDANDIKAGKEANPFLIQVGPREMKLISDGRTAYRKGNTLILLGPIYYSSPVTLVYANDTSSFSLHCSENFPTRETICSTDLADIADVNIRTELFNDFLVQFRELVDEANVITTSAMPTLISLENQNRVNSGKSD